ncbi:hypothetical protein BP5796_09071 [Coleophoma crateriformis]|uniref:carboxypeptidase C n=1 Tax=Coleophoma crateriformis TaxID=565419 RepID=A0A3D8R3M0_9HELO|nr:hypothetical protein BP5796_09071 [Coleophoma crateriformis]
MVLVMTASSSSQPAGVGFSQKSPNTSARVTTLEQATEDFNEFLFILFQSYLPQYASHPLHFAAESYGGRWGPAFIDRIVGLQRADSRRAILNPVKSLILVNAVIGSLGGYLTTGKYEFGCTPTGQATKLGLGYNGTACAAISEAGPSCEVYAELCERTSDLTLCAANSAYCWAQISPWVEIPDRNPYNIGQPCSNPEDLCLEGLTAAQKYYNLPWVQQALGFQDFNYSAFNLDLNADFGKSLAVTQSVLPLVVNILDHTDIKILFLNGNLDSLTVTPGQQRIVDNIRWKGQLDYRQKEFQDWFYVDAFGQKVLGGQLKGSDKLKFVAFEGAGHMVPGDQPQAASYILEDWLRGF